VKITFDANIFISRKQQLLDLPGGFYLSAIVLQELVAGAPDEATVKKFAVMRDVYEKKNRVLVPDLEDWWQVGRILNSLQRGRRSPVTGNIPKISVDERLRITNDVLLARTARSEGVVIVTDNAGDFDKIRPLCAVKTVSGEDYFGE
jgi:predicted nucleic acid-binding protein